MVETRIAIGFGEDAERAVSVLRQVLQDADDVGQEPRPQVGIHDFTYGGVIIGLRFWVPGRQYFQTRYRVNDAFLHGLKAARIGLLPANGTAMAAHALTADHEV